jgi:hypothetical protein
MKRVIVTALRTFTHDGLLHTAGEVFRVAPHEAVLMANKKRIKLGGRLDTTRIDGRALPSPPPDPIPAADSSLEPEPAPKRTRGSYRRKDVTSLITTDEVPEE